MKPQFTKSTGFKLGFKLNMQIIADALEETFSQMELYDTENTCCLEGVKIFSAKIAGQKGTDKRISGAHGVLCLNRNNLLVKIFFSVNGRLSVHGNAPSHYVFLRSAQQMRRPI